MMHGREKSDPAIVAGKPTNKVASATAEPVEPRAGAERNAGQQSTHPDTGTGMRVTWAGSRTASRKAKEEGEVHRASAPRRRRSATGIVPCAQTQSRPRRGWADMAGLCSRP